MAKGGGSTKTVSASNASASRQNSKINESVLDWKSVKLSKTNIPEKEVMGNHEVASAYYKPASGKLLIGSKFFNVDFENETLTHYMSGVKVGKNTSAYKSFQRFLEANKKAILKQKNK